jgi:site-specific recombinase XerD
LCKGLVVFAGALGDDGWVIRASAMRMGLRWWAQGVLCDQAAVELLASCREVIAEAEHVEPAGQLRPGWRRGGRGGERTKVFASKREAVGWEVHRHRTLSGIAAAHIESAQRAWKSNDISPTVVAGTLNCLARLFRFAIKLGDLSASPMSAVERARASVEGVTPTLMVEEVDRLAAACDLVSRRYGDYVRLAALLGLRAGELTALQVGDVDLTTGGNHPPGILRRRVADSEVSAVRQVPVLAELVPILARMTTDRRPAEPVLLGPLGGRLYHSNFRMKVRWPALVGELGWPGLHFHDLRATAIVLWIRAEVPLTTVRALAGHASLATTDRYARIA